MKKYINRLLIQIPLIGNMLHKRNEKNKLTHFFKNIKKAPPVFVYQMGKVASSSAYFSIKNQYSGICLHSHSFTKDHDDIGVKALHSLLSKEKYPVKIISMVREPISRNISAFFQNFERDTGTKYRDSTYSAEELLEIFLKNYKHQIPLEWFDNNIEKNFGIDVFITAFPKCGYDSYKNGELELLLYKHDIDDDVKEKIIADFIHLNNFKLHNTNIGNHKEYSSIYKNFKGLDLPKYYIDAMLNSKYATHFYPNDLSQIRKKWEETANHS